MLHPKVSGLLCQAKLDTILKHPDHPFYLLIGFTITKGGVVVDDAQPFTEPCKAACKVGTVIYLDVA